jgi:hypothetical protein
LVAKQAIDRGGDERAEALLALASAAGQGLSQLTQIAQSITAGLKPDIQNAMMVDSVARMEMMSY